MAGKKAKQFDKNPVEAVRNPFEDLGIKNIPKDIVKQTLNESKQGASNFIEQLLGLGPFKLTGEMAPGQEIDFKPKRTEKKEEVRVESGIDYTNEILQGERRITRHEQLQANQKIEQLMEEIRKLASSSKTLQVEFREVVVEQRPVSIGKYHINFFEWLLAVVRDARTKVEESNSWLNAFAAKKSKREYWGLAKKHGTSFTLSGERTVSTQTG